MRTAPSLRLVIPQHPLTTKSFGCGKRLPNPKSSFFLRSRTLSDERSSRSSLVVEPRSLALTPDGRPMPIRPGTNRCAWIERFPRSPILERAVGSSNCKTPGPVFCVKSPEIQSLSSRQKHELSCCSDGWAHRPHRPTAGQAAIRSESERGLLSRCAGGP